MTRKYMITGLLAAGFGHHDPLQAALTRAASTDRPDEGKLFQLFRQDHLYTLAGHSSHSSHASHASHYSSTGGYTPPTYSPAPVYAPPLYSPPAPSPAPASPAPSSDDTSSFGSPVTSKAATPAPLPGRSELFKKVVRRVQVALMGRGLFEGPIDGTVGLATRAALRQFQQSQGLAVTGTITAQTLDALHVPSQ